MEFSIETDVDAPADVVYAVLTDVEAWPEWTDTVTRVERLGDTSRPLAVDSRIRIMQPKVPPAEYTVTELEAGRGFRMMSRSPGATVVANHWVERLADARSRVTLSVTFSGWLGSVIARMSRNMTKRYLAEEAAGLKRRSEERVRARSRS